jgi:hypothetical protein
MASIFSTVCLARAADQAAAVTAVVLLDLLADASRLDVQAADVQAADADFWAGAQLIQVVAAKQLAVAVLLAAVTVAVLLVDAIADVLVEHVVVLLSLLAVANRVAAKVVAC